MIVPRVVVSMAWGLRIKDDQRWSESRRIVWAICLRTESMLFAILCCYKLVAKCSWKWKTDAAVFFGEGEVSWLTSFMIISPPSGGIALTWRHELMRHPDVAYTNHTLSFHSCLFPSSHEIHVYHLWYIYVDINQIKCPGNCPISPPGSKLSRWCSKQVPLG